MCQHTRSSVIATKPFYTRMLLFYIAIWDTKLFFLFCKILIGMQRHEWITALKIPNVVAGVYQSWSLLFHFQSESVISKIPSTIKWKVSFLRSLFPEEASLELGYCWSNSGSFCFFFFLTSFISAASLKQKVITMSINTKQALLIRDEQKTSYDIVSST